MTWFNIAKSALSQAQRSIDKVLDIEQNANQGESGQVPTISKNSKIFYCLFGSLSAGAYWDWECTCPSCKSKSPGDTVYLFYVGSNTSRSTGATTDDHSKPENTDGSSFWASFNDKLKPGTHSTPKAGHSQPSSTDSLSFDEDSHWGAYFSPPQTTSLPSSAKSTPKRSTSLDKDKTSPTLLENSAATQSLPSPTIKTSKSGPLKLGSSKNKNHSKAKEVDTGKPEAKPEDCTTKVTVTKESSSNDSITTIVYSETDNSDRIVTKELATSSSDSFTTISSVNTNENVRREQKLVDNCEGGQPLQPVTTSELLLLASTENAEISSSSDSNVNRVTSNTGIETSSSPVQHFTEEVDSIHSVSPVPASEPQSSSNEEIVAAALQDAEIDRVKSENKETMSLSSVPVVAEEVTSALYSDEISSTAEYVIVSKEIIADEPVVEPVSDISEQITELSQITEPLADNSVAGQKELLQEEDKLEEKQTDKVSGSDNSVEMQNLDNNNESSLPTASNTIPTVLADEVMQAVSGDPHVSGDPQASSDPYASGDPHVQSHNNRYEEELQQLRNVS